MLKLENPVDVLRKAKLNQYQNPSSRIFRLEATSDDKFEISTKANQLSFKAEDSEEKIIEECVNLYFSIIAWRFKYESKNDIDTKKIPELFKVLTEIEDTDDYYDKIAKMSKNENPKELEDHFTQRLKKMLEKIESIEKKRSYYGQGVYLKPGYEGCKERNVIIENHSLYISRKKKLVGDLGSAFNRKIFRFNEKFEKDNQQKRKVNLNALQLTIKDFVGCRDICNKIWDMGRENDDNVEGGLCG